MRTIGIIVLLWITVNTYAPKPAPYDMEEVKRIEELIIKRMKEKNFNRFLDALALQESSNNPQAYNKYGYLGKYQLGRSARKSTGYEHVTYHKFVTNPDIWPEDEQDIAMRKLIMKNTAHLAVIINQHDSTCVKGNMITKSGILAAAHLAGAGGVKKFFSSNGRYNPSDAYGTHLSDYLIEYSGYNF